MSELREAIQSAMKVDEEETVTETPAEVVEAPAEKEETVETPAVEESKVDEGKEQKKDEKKQAADGRDEKGRFAAKAEADAKAAAAAGKPAPVAGAAAAAAKPAPVAGAEAIKPPQSWTPAAREEWAKVPPAVQKEIARREKETSVAIQQGTEARKFGDAFGQVVGPYMGMIAAAGSHPLQTVGRLLQTAAALRTEPGPNKARIVADLIKQYGVPIEDLDAALAGVAPKPGQQRQAEPPRDPRVDDLLAQRQQEQQQRQQQTAARATAELEAFKATHEFVGDVENDMVEIITLARRRGVAMTLEQAYDRACSLHPEISGVMKQREAAKAAAKAPASTQRSKAAASSVRSTPAAGVNSAQPDDLRSSIKAAVVAASGR